PSAPTSGPSIVPNMWTGVTGAKYCVTRMAIHSSNTKTSAGHRRKRGSARLTGADSSACQAGCDADGTWEAMSLMRCSEFQGTGGWEKRGCGRRARAITLGRNALGGTGIPARPTGSEEYFDGAGRSSYQNKWLRCPRQLLVPGPQGARDAAVIVAPEVRRGAAGGLNHEDFRRALGVGGAETAGAFRHEDARRERVETRQLEQLRSKVRACARGHDNVDAADLQHRGAA